MSRLPHTSSSVVPGAHLRLDGVSFSYPGRRVLTDVSFTVSAGQRVGIIGSNGSGKTTLLHLVAGRLAPTAGTLAVSGSEEVRIGLLRQEAPFSPDSSVAQALERAVEPARRAAVRLEEAASALAREPEGIEAAAAYSRALETAEELGAWRTDARIAATVSGLGLACLDRGRQVGCLSGGQRARLALACLLLSAPEVLLLDEPTNHLDDDAVSFLVEVLTAWRGPVLMASHDRAFLDEAATHLIDLDPSPVPQAVAGPLLEEGPGSGIGILRHTGSYSRYVAARAEAALRWQRRYDREQAEIARLRAAVRDEHTVGHEEWAARTEVRAAQKYYADRNARVVSRRVTDARARLEAAQAEQIRRPPSPLEFRLPATPGTGCPAAACDDGPDDPVLVATGVGVTGRLAPTSLTARPGQRWLVTGPNGSGKSTLLAVLAGALVPTCGQVNRPHGDRVGLLAQDGGLADPVGRGPGRTAAQAYTDLVGVARAQEVPLTAFGLISPRDLDHPVEALSLGQIRRLALAALLADPPWILLLDEPTNHLALDLVTALEEALLTYPGAVVVASHDRWLRRRWSGEHLEIGPGAGLGRRSTGGPHSTLSKARVCWRSPQEVRRR